MNYDQWKLMSDRDGKDEEEDLSIEDKFDNWMYENDNDLPDEVINYIEDLQHKLTIQDLKKW